MTHLSELAKVLKDIEDNPRTAPGINPALYPCFEALKATLDFLDRLQPFRGEGRGLGLTRPLWDLLAALSDLDEGVTHPMLQAVETGHRGSSMQYQALTAWAAIAMDALMKTGTASDEAARRIEASRRVAAELSAIRTSSGNRRNSITDTTVRSWRSDLNRNKGKKYAQIAWDRYTKQRAASTSSPEMLASWAMQMLTRLARDPTLQIADFA